MDQPIKILLLEDNKSDVELIRHQIVKSGIKFQWLHISTLEDFEKELYNYKPDLILSDYNLISFTGLDALEIVKDLFPLVPFIIVTGTIDEETAAETIKAGAWDYVVKERLSRLSAAIHNTILLKKEKEMNFLTEEKLKIMSRALEQASSAIVITNYQGNIEYTNPKFTELTGYNQNEVLGKNPKFLKSGQHSLLFYKNLWDTILSGNEWRGELINKKKNGELYWESTSISCVKNTDNIITHFIAIKEDITDKKNTEKELLKAKERAEESDKLKTAFLQNVSHEIRTPMNGIMGFTDLLKESVNSEEKRTLYLDIIQNSCNRMLNTIHDIIEMSKLQTEEIQVHNHETNIGNVLHSLFYFFQPKAEEKGLILDLKLNGSHKIITDDIKLNAIFSNVLNNAVKYTHKGRIEFGYQIKNKKIEFYVSDTGIGIPKNMRTVVFDRFRKFNNDLSSGFEGSGLGLSIAKAYVELLNGEIWVESNKQEGSIFYFTLPK
jgi:PAS domain S-box-containing protein